MSSRSRTALLAALVAVAAGTFVVLQPGDDDTTTATTVTTTRTATTPAATTPAPTTTTPTATTGTPTPTTPRIRVKGGQPVGGVAELTVKEGDRIRFTVTADAPEHVHLHGYDIEKPVTPGTPVRIPFTADLPGRFELELHHPDALLAVIEVKP